MRVSMPFLISGFAAGVMMAQSPEPKAAEPAKAAVPAKPHLLPPEKEGALPCDSKDRQPVLVGATTRAAVLGHRDIFRNNTAAAVVQPEWSGRWKALDTPCLLVAAFGSWCGDSQRELPDLLALMKDENPFVKVHLLGVYRDKKTAPEAWPQGLEPQAVAKVPTFWLYVQQPGGGYRLADAIVENPPKAGQRMAEAILEMLEKVK